MSNLKFFKGRSEALPIKEDRLSHSFYLSEDTNDFYYTDENKKLIRLSADPDTTVKEIHTFYSNAPGGAKPASYPIPEGSSWKENVPEDYDVGEELYFITCTVYMSGKYEFSDVQGLITYDEIDLICTY